MPDVYVGQRGTSVVKMYDDQGRETDSYDKITGIAYDSTNPAALSISDPDAEPKDAEIVATAVGQNITLSCTFDGDPGDGERSIRLEAGPFNVLEPPPGEAATATFEVVWEPVEP
jgi:hypothetical protein